MTPTVLGSTNIIINNTQVNNASTTPESLVEAINGAGITGVGAKVDANGRVKIYSDGTSSTDGTTTDGAILTPRRSGQISTDCITAGYYKEPSYKLHTVRSWRFN